MINSMAAAAGGTPETEEEGGESNRRSHNEDGEITDTEAEERSSTALLSEIR